MRCETFGPCGRPLRHFGVPLSGLGPVFLIGAALLRAAETGDFDGDGKLTIGDMVRVAESAEDPSVELAPGSLDAFSEYPPYAAEEDPFFLHGGPNGSIALAVYLESLRRTLPESFPPYVFMHWPERWLEEIAEGPLPEDSRVTVELRPVETAGEPMVLVPLRLTATAPVRAFSLVLESPEGMLRVPWVWLESPISRWKDTYWGRFPWATLAGKHDDGDLTVNVPPAGYLVSGGRYVVIYGLRGDRNEGFPEGTYEVLARGRLPKGTDAGTYPLTLHPASQVLLADGTVISPVVEGAGEIVVTEDIDTGWDEGLPPLRFDLENRRVLGKVEFRFAAENGNPVPEGEPIARGLPGEEIRLRVQVRTEVPLNFLNFRVRWPGGLVCTEKSSALHGQEGEPVLVSPRSGVDGCWSRGIYGSNYFGMSFRLGSNWRQIGPDLQSLTSFPDRPFEYFKPLDEWVDLWEAVMKVPERPPRSVIPLGFERRFIDPPAEFAPYRVDHYYPEAGRASDRDLWEYDVSYGDNVFVEVVGGEPPEPPDIGLRFALGDVIVEPGGTAEIPIVASAEPPQGLGLGSTWLVLESDPESVIVEAVRTWAQILMEPRFPPREVIDTGEVREVVVDRGSASSFVEPFGCDPPPDTRCFGQPLSVFFRESDERFAIIDWGGTSRAKDFPTREPEEIGRLVVRAAEEPEATETTIRAAVVIEGHGPFERTYISSGVPIGPDENPEEPISPATEVIPARVFIGGGAFVRGDVNADDRLNMTDPIALLVYLFQGTESPPRCLDAGDANDDGRLNLTDGIYLLQWLFTAEALAPPEPHPGCGADPTEDEVSCKEIVCREG